MTGNREKARAIFLTVVMVLSMVGSGIAFSGGAAAQTADIVVDADGDGDYTLIQEAVDNAGDTDRIVVEPGTYDESVQISKNITLVAPNGATITNSSQVTNRYGISIYGPVNATVSGFTLTDWQWGVSAGGSEGDWTLRNTTMSNISEMAIGGAGTPGDWTVTNVSVYDTETGISGYESTGDWSIVDSTFDNVSEVVFADRTAGNWSITSTTIKHSREDAITVDQSTSNWTVSDTSIYDINGQGIDTTNAGGSGIIENTSISHTSSDAVDVGDSSIDVLVSNVSIYNSSTYGIEAGNSSGEIVIQSSVINETADHGIEVEKSTSNWEITDTEIRNSAGDGIDAYKAENTGDINNVTIDSVEGNGINLYNATGTWSITDSKITNTNLSSVTAGETTGQWNINRTIFSDGTLAVDAVNSTYEGDAAYNYWGASDGPSGDFNGSGAAAVGNLTVSPAYTDSTLSTLTVVSNDNTSTLPANWETFHGDQGRTGYQPNLSGPRSDLGTRFDSNIGDQTGTNQYTINSPTVVDGVAYITATDTDNWNDVARAVNVTTGEVLWSFDSSDAAYASRAAPTIGEDNVYFTAQDLNTHYVYAVDRETGEEVWSFGRSSSDINSVPVLAKGQVFVRTSDAYNQDYVYAFNASTGNKNWEWQLPSDADGNEDSEGSIAYSSTSDLLYVPASYDLDSSPDTYQYAGYVYGVDPNTGLTNVTHKTEAGVDSTPTAVGDVVFFTDNDAYLHKKSTGSSNEWDVRLRRDSEATKSVAVDSDTVYAISTELGVGSYLHAINRTDGSQRWVHNFPDDDTANYAPVINKQSLYVSSGGYFYVINTNNGSVVTSIYNGRLASAPSLAGESVYIGGRDDRLFGYISDSDAPVFNSATRVDNMTIATTITDKVNVDESTIDASDFNLSVGSVASVSSTESGTDTKVIINLDAGVDSDLIDISVVGSISDRHDNQLTSGNQTVSGMDSVAPLADAGVNMTATENTSIRFNGTNSTDGNTIIAYNWSFGDGATATGPTPSHTYIDPGTYTVTLTVEDGAGNTDTDSVAVSVEDVTSPVSVNTTNVTTLAGTNATVDYTLKNNRQKNSSYILNLSLPEGWTAVDYDNDGGDRQDGEAKWLWQTITPNETVSPSVTLEVPENIEGTYTISGDALSDDSIVAQADATVTVFDGNLNASLNEQTIGNGTEAAITVEAPRSDGSFVDVTDQAVYVSNNTGVATVDANGIVTAKSTGTATINASYDNRVANVTITVEPATVEEAVDANNNNQIDDVEILQAITYWQDNEAVPRTDGDSIGDFEILNLIEQWRYNTEI